MNKKMVRRLLTVLAVCFAAASLWFLYSFWQTMQEYRRGDEDLTRIYEIMGGVPATVPAEEMKQLDEPEKRAVLEEERQQKEESYTKLEAINSDMIGWIRIDGTVVDYPVMQTPEEPDFYLRRGFDKKYSSYGMIYMDASCDWQGECPNYILYGHHMKNGSMFASIEKYDSVDYYRAHPQIGFDTLEENADYEIVGAFKLPADQMGTAFAYLLAARTEENYTAFIDYVKTHAFYDTGITPTWPEQLVTLTTCEYTQRNGRFFVVARKIGGEQ